MTNASSIPPELKRITQYIRRAEELDNDDRPECRIVAFCCRQYAVEIGLSSSNTPVALNYLSNILSQLEREKKAMAAYTPKQRSNICRKFALEIFDIADNEDRSNNATKETAKTFYVATTFLKILEYYDDFDDDIKEKHDYARWKAVEINKAINESRKLIPGGYGELEAFMELREKIKRENKKKNSVHKNHSVPNSSSRKYETAVEKKDIDYLEKIFSKVFCCTI